MTHQPELIPDQPSTAPSSERDVDREAYLERLREYLQDPDFRAIEGFPIGEDEDILALSDPPYYTACPNPFLPEIIERWQEERAQLRAELGLPDDSNANGDGESVYHREPFAADVSEGKHSSIYRAHTYHTKVPHKAVMRYILHYTDPGDIVFDGFCGTGMTGVAAQLCQDRKAVRELGYRVDGDGIIYDGKQPISCLGVRRSGLVDLCPSATFIAYNYNTPADPAAFKRDATRVLNRVKEECGWMYETWHPSHDAPNPTKGTIKYVVWSDVFICPQCSEGLVFFEVALDARGNVTREFDCPACSANLTKRDLEHATRTFFDPLIGETRSQNTQLPVLINYTTDSGRYEKRPDQEDLQLIDRVRGKLMSNGSTVAPPYPMMLKGGEDWGAIWRAGYHRGITHSHHFYTARNYYVLSRLWDEARSPSVRWAITAILNYVNKKQSYTGGGGGMPGVLYIASLVQEKSVFDVFRRKIRALHKVFRARRIRPADASITTHSATDLQMIPDSVFDYAFVDPPFGKNIMYSEGSFLWETWLGVFTNSRPEAIINAAQQKGLSEYQRLMERSFGEFHRVLKPGRWMTIEFHNSKNRVWNAIQEAVLRAGFVIADVRTLDKQQASFKQVTSTGAVKRDLVISAYKPRSRFERRFLEQAGTTAGAWAFVRQHLGQLPVVVRTDGELETLSERQDYLLFDRMVAFHIQRGATVPLSAAEFYKGLRERFVERDGMFLLPDQVPEYDRARLEAESVAQLSYFVDDEKSAIQWLRQQLDPHTGGHRQTYQDIQPRFLQQLHQARHEELPELSEILDQNFLEDEKDRWYVPDPNKASDLEKLRRKALLREFKEYADGRGRLRKFRTEAVRAGFADAWQRNDYETIVQVAERLPEEVLQEDADLLMYYDNASLRVEA